MEADPLVRDTSIGFVLALLVSVAFSALVVAVAVVRDVASRHGEIALLRALGTRPRQVLGVIVVEQGTVVLSAVAAGLALGCLMGILAVPSLGLDRFVRPGRLVDAVIEWPVVSSVAVGQALVALLIMLVGDRRRETPRPRTRHDARRMSTDRRRRAHRRSSPSAATTWSRSTRSPTSRWSPSRASTCTSSRPR